MTENEAIKDIKRQILEIESDDSDITLSTESLYMAIKALEKQIPKKPIRKPNADMTYEEVTCPSCGRYVSQYRNEYYCDCGQKIDWH